VIDLYTYATPNADTIAARPAVKRGILVPPRDGEGAVSSTARENLFGNAQYERR
jgi:hypothetical protein